MKSLKYLLKKNFSKAGKMQTNIDEKTVFFIFRKVMREDFGELGAENFKTDYFSGKIIFVKTGSSAWASELWINRKRMVKRINEELGGSFVEDLKIK